jgi:hypothetical protein
MEDIRAQNELVVHAVKSVQPDTSDLRASIEAATIAKHHNLLQRSPLRIPVWAGVTALTILIIFTFLFYVPKFLWPRADSLFQAVGRNHIMCSHDADAPDWARTQPAIVEVEESFIGPNQHAPIATSEGYQLVRARVCVLNGEKFLHLVYESQDGREASLFVGQHNEPIPGDRTVTLDGKSIEVAHIDDLNVVGLRAGNHVVIAVAQENKIATSLLLSAVSSLSV